ncbi:hypothetical protein P8H27_03360 [Pseudomonas sp. sp1636]|uniref:hypothetical protein n=1 Tax=Pseudomonas sp. sp1636 TaxID=3036707 RepID=UPI0025A4EE0E|nr:hypothetical protein [Pseudomonas sp. sp1636]MDM8347932.1 hypothetical protein [Pseudomonas sp. sp1636]
MLKLTRLALRVGEPLADGDFDLLQGRWRRLDASDLGLAWCIALDRSGLRIVRETPADVITRTIRG